MKIGPFIKTETFSFIEAGLTLKREQECFNHGDGVIHYGARSFFVNDLPVTFCSWELTAFNDYKIKIISARNNLTERAKF